ncbi:hypothetical protein EYC80_008460 [Monilinia laxa]|uniref:Uncharacterized protein n=1 Tax=Monilinia laxa TaxID=61186 RepID=A0A5N6JQB1_MONLA|nr:hypothetical protein EYC80_008460 [Monilinia laxa]
MDTTSGRSSSPPPPSPPTTPTRRNSIESIRSTKSSSSNTELEILRAEVARQNLEVERSAVGLGITRGPIESEPLTYRGVQSAPRPLPVPPRREPLPVVERPTIRRSQHSRSSSSSLPRTESSEFDAYATRPPITSNTYVPPQSSQGRKMNYQGFGDPNQSGQPSSSRQAPPSPGQGMPHANGMNGQMNMAGMANMIGFPTPAGHQSDLNYIMVMVEELSRLLAANQKITDSILEKIGNELNAGSENLENENSQLRRAIEQSKTDADENWKLVLHAASILEDIKEKAHNYKFQHEKDTLAWHKSYRDQLAQERKENLELRCHIADMQAHAAKANDYINQLRRYASEHKIITELTTKVAQYKAERRFWKHYACPGLREDPSEWSDDEGGATGDIPEAEKIACASYIAEREEMARIILGKNDDEPST